MEAGDKVLVLLLAKLACFGLALVATGALGDLGVSLLDGASPGPPGLALIALIAVIVLGRSDYLIY